MGWSAEARAAAAAARKAKHGLSSAAKETTSGVRDSDMKSLTASIKRGVTRDKALNIGEDHRVRKSYQGEFIHNDVNLHTKDPAKVADRIVQHDTISQHLDSAEKTAHISAHNKSTWPSATAIKKMDPKTAAALLKSIAAESNRTVWGDNSTWKAFEGYVKRLHNAGLPVYKARSKLSNSPPTSFQD